MVLVIDSFFSVCLNIQSRVEVSAEISLVSVPVTPATMAEAPGTNKGRRGRSSPVNTSDSKKLKTNDMNTDNAELLARLEAMEAVLDTYKKTIDQLYDNERKLKKQLREAQKSDESSHGVALTNRFEMFVDPENNTTAPTTPNTNTQPQPTQANSTRTQSVTHATQSETRAPTASASQPAAQQPATSSVKTPKLPPINIFSQASRKIIDFMKERGIKEYTVRKAGGDKHVLQMMNIGDYDVVRQQLKNDSVQHFTYTPAQNKRQSFILRGLDGDEDEAQVLADLQQLNLTAVEFLKVSKLTNGVARANTLFVVQATAASVEATIFKSTKLNNVIVRWERLQRKEILQCRRCQRLGHTASNCGMQFRCVKCAEVHEPGQCKLPAATKHEPDQVYCIACKEYGHPASYRGCPQIKQFKDAIAKRKAAAHHEAARRRQCVDNYVRPNVSFRDAMHSMSAPGSSANARSAPPPAPTPAAAPPPPSGVDPAIADMLVRIVTAALVPLHDALQKNIERVNQLYDMIMQ